jgi:AcrR family transcriptional regulator
MTADAGSRSKPQMRAKVLRAALEAIEKLGPDRVRVQDISARAGMSSGHVMYYFGDRDRILVGTLLLSEDNLAQRRDRAVRRAVDPWDAVDRVSRLYLPGGPKDVRWTLWAQALARPPADADTRTALREAVDSWSACLATVIRQGVASGHFRSLEADATAYRYCRFMDGLAMEVLLGSPGRARAWAVGQAAEAWRSTAAVDRNP